MMTVRCIHAKLVSFDGSLKYEFKLWCQCSKHYFVVCVYIYAIIFEILSYIRSTTGNKAMKKQLRNLKLRITFVCNHTLVAGLLRMTYVFYQHPAFSICFFDASKSNMDLIIMLPQCNNDMPLLEMTLISIRDNSMVV